MNVKIIINETEYDIISICRYYGMSMWIFSDGTIDATAHNKNIDNCYIIKHPDKTLPVMAEHMETDNGKDS